MTESSPQDLLEAFGDRMVRDVPEVVRDLETFRALLTKWQKAKNLVSRETLDAFWTRHILDSVQLLLLLPERELVIFDLGSGGGFPALPLAIALKGYGTKIVMHEANGRKAAFLRAVIRELDLNAHVREGRIETHDSRETGRADIITARAFAPLPRLLGMAWPLIKRDGGLLLHKGREYVEELAESDAVWGFDVVLSPSRTDPQGVILSLANLRQKGG